MDNSVSDSTCIDFNIETNQGQYIAFVPVFQASSVESYMSLQVHVTLLCSSK